MSLLNKLLKNRKMYVYYHNDLKQHSLTDYTKKAYRKVVNIADIDTNSISGDYAEITLKDSNGVFKIMVNIAELDSIELI